MRATERSNTKGTKKERYSTILVRLDHIVRAVVEEKVRYNGLCKVGIVISYLYQHKFRSINTSSELR